MQAIRVWPRSSKCRVARNLSTLVVGQYCIDLDVGQVTIDHHHRHVAVTQIIQESAWSPAATKMIPSTCFLLRTST